MNLVFNAEEHKYYLDGAPIPGVNELFVSTGIKDDSFYRPGMADKGKYVHKVIEAINLGLDVPVRPEGRPYLVQYEQWMTDNEVEVLEAEKQSYHKYYHYAGTLDILAQIGRNVAIVDVKTGAKLAWHELQLIAYGMIHESWEGNRPDIYGLYITEDGYNFIQYTYDDDAIVEAALRIYKWRSR